MTVKTVLVVAAHPDDEVLGCGGTIGRLAQEGHEVHIALLGEGITSRFQQPEQADRELVEALRAHAIQAKNQLRAKSLSLFELPDNRFDTVPLLEVIKIIEDLIARLVPKIIYTHHGGDLNIDHSIVHRAVLTATRPMEGQPVQEVYAFEIPSCTEWSFQRLESAFHPDTFVDIADTLVLKVIALSYYESERRTFPHPRSPEAIRAAAHRWGSVVGVEAAEAFELVRRIV